VKVKTILKKFKKRLSRALQLHERCVGVVMQDAALQCSYRANIVACNASAAGALLERRGHDA
jgi:hypothetical protein